VTSSPGVRQRRARGAAHVGALLAFVVAAIPCAVDAQLACAAGEGTTSFRQETSPGQGVIRYLGTPHLLCEGDVEIWADSAVTYSNLGLDLLMGSVRYMDRTRELTADTARYFSDRGRLQATGHVFIRDEGDGSRIENGDLVYLRVTDFREEESMTVTTGSDGVRPRAVMTPSAPDSVGPEAERPTPYTVVGDQIFLRGDTYFSAAGTVEIERDSLYAFADSAEYDEALDRLLLVENARVLTETYELLGRTIAIGTPGAESSEIRAVRAAQLTGDDLVLTSPQIVVVLGDGTLERLVATPIPVEDDAEPDSADIVRPVAVVEDFELTADSLEVTAPDDVLERVVAVGRARSTSSARDSVNVEILPEIARSDWLEGDTVIVTFRPLEPDSYEVDVDAPEGRDYEVEKIVARVDARTLYRLTPADSNSVAGTDPPALHYVVGTEITITMVDGEVDAMQVVGQTRGVHLEPLARPAEPDSAADSLRAQPDTSGIAQGNRPSRVAPDTAGRRKTPAHRSRPRKEEPWRRK
jgi:lipopolysaccharide export system protein LptA